MDVFANNGYHRIFNNIGLNALDRGIHIPDAALGIGFAENLAPVPLLASFQPIMKAPEPSAVESIEDTKAKLTGSLIKKDTFSFTPYYGDALGGF